jgi:hypothetical protein
MIFAGSPFTVKTKMRVALSKESRTSHDSPLDVPQAFSERPRPECRSIGAGSGVRCSERCGQLGILLTSVRLYPRIMTRQGEP